MRTNKSMLKSTFLGMALSVVTSMATFSGAMANDEQYLNSDPININGYVQDDAPVSDAELETVKHELQKQKTAIIVNKQKKKKYNELSRSTEKLADVTEDMIEERKESKTTIDKFNKKIDCLMAEGLKEGCEEFVKAPRQDNISLKQAAPIVTEAPLKAASSDEKFGSIIKVIPYSGLTTLMSEGESLEAGLVGGIKVETNVNKRFSVGMGFNYTSLTTEDFGSNSNYLGNFNNQYNSFYGGREIDYKNMNFGIHSKFFIIKNDRFRPYVGAGFGYNRTSLEYSNNTNANAGYTAGAFNNFSFGNEEVTTSSVNLELMIGSEIKFTESIGANLELNYVRVLGGNISTENGLNTAFNPDQQRLEDLSSELSEANIVSLFAGLLVEF